MKTQPDTPPNSTGRPAGKRIAVVAIAELFALTLWLWPLMYMFSEGECGADIGIGLFGVPAAFAGLGACIVLAAKFWRDRLTVLVCAVGVVAASSSLVGLIGDVQPYAQWLQYAIDRWYDGC